METKSLSVGFIIGLVVAGTIGYGIFPPIDNSHYEDQIATLHGYIDSYEIQISDLESEKSTLENTIADKTIDNQLRLNEINELEFTNIQLQNTISRLRDLVFIETSYSRTENTAADIVYWMNRANESIKGMVMTLTNDQLRDALNSAKDRGIDVQFIIDSDWLYSSGSDYTDLLNSQIDIRSDERSGLMHHKVLIIDDHVVVTGSYNWSDSAEDSNDENIIILKSNLIAQEYQTEFQRIWAQTHSNIPEPEPEPEPEPTPETGKIVINEVEANPAGTDDGNEWVELYNPSNNPVDVSGWKISSTHGETVTITIPQGTMINPGSYKVYSHSSQWIDNEAEQMVLYNAKDQEQDRTRIFYDTSNDGKTWQRSPNGRDTDTEQDWQLKTSTKGIAN